MASRWRVVLVDDDDSLRRALARTIRLAGYEVETYRTADDCARAGGFGALTCLVLDVNLPGTSGIAFRGALAASGQDPPTIFITALDRDDRSVDFDALGPVEVLHKPFRNDELLAAIGRACSA